LGEGDFVEAVLKAAQEKLDRKYHVQSRGYNFERLVKRVAKLFEISPKELLSGGKHTKTVKARSVVCYWRNRELGMSTIELSKKNEYIPTDSESIRGTRSENRPRGKVGVSGMTKPIIQWNVPKHTKPIIQWNVPKHTLFKVSILRMAS